MVKYRAWSGGVDTEYVEKLLSTEAKIEPRLVNV